MNEKIILKPEDDYYYKKYLELSKEELAERLIDNYNHHQKVLKRVLIVAVFFMLLFLFVYVIAGLTAIAYGLGSINGLEMQWRNLL